MRERPTNSDDIIDSCDVLEAIKELEEERQALVDRVDDLKEWDESDEAEELKALKALAEKAEGCASDWPHHATLIRDSYFVEYAQELAEDIGAVGENSSWIVIDWEATANAMLIDYTSIEFDGVTYWIR